MVPDDLERLCLGDPFHWPREDISALFAVLDQFKISRDSPFAALLERHTLQFAGSKKNDRIRHIQLLDPVSHLENTVFVQDVYQLEDGQITLTTTEGEGIDYYDSLTDQVRERLLPDLSGSSDTIVFEGFFDFMREYLV
jgi:hypothetical protein